MKTLLTSVLLLALALGAAYGEVLLSPCPSGPDAVPCDTPANTQKAIQEALDSAAPGDTIELQAGRYAIRTRLNLPNKPGAEWITIRTARHGELPPDGYRLRDSDVGLLAILYTTISSEPVIATPQKYVRLGSASEPFSAAISGQTLTIGGGCSEQAPCRMMSRNGTLLSLTAPVGSITMTPPLTSSGSLTIGIDNDGKLTIGKRPELEEGKHFTCANCGTIFDRYQTYSTEYEPNSVPILNKVYDAGGWSMDSAWKSGVWSSTRIFATGPWAAKGGYGVYGPEPDAPYKGGAAGPHHFRFKGIGFAVAPRVYQYWLVGIGVDSLSFYDYRDMPHDIEFDQCFFTGEREHPTPSAQLRLRAENVWIKNSLFRWAGTGGQDGQQISIMDDCPGPLFIENNDLDGASENIMAGGAGAILAGYSPVMRFRRNFVWKRLDYRTDFEIRHVSGRPDQLEFYWNPSHNGTAGALCGAAANLPCDYYFDDLKLTISEDSRVTLKGSASGQGWFAYNDAGLSFFHNMGDDAVSCSGQVTCSNGYAAIPDGHNYFVAWSAANGAWAGLPTGRRFQKNLWECKNCQDTVVEGNLFFQYWRDQQNYAFALTPRNQSGAEPWVAMDNVLFTRNILTSAANGVNLIGIDDGGLQTYARAVVFSHNVFNDINGPRWDAASPNLRGIAFKINASDKSTLEAYHNTIRLSGFQTWFSASKVDASKGSHVRYKNNLFLWDPNGQMTGDNGPNGFSAAYNYYKLDPASSYQYNLNLTSLLNGSFPANNYTSTSPFASVLNSVGSPGSFTDDLRIQPSSPWSSHCTSGCSGPDSNDGSRLSEDGLDLGADIDWVETLTDGVREGLPPLAERFGLKVEPIFERGGYLGDRHGRDAVGADGRHAPEYERVECACDRHRAGLCR